MGVNIILCSRNGEKYLRDQLDSILKQTDPCVRLLISDDASADGTRAIISEYAERYPDRVSVCFREAPSGGAARHFFLALRHFAEAEAGKGAGAPGEPTYWMFADQDDLWHPDKTEKTLRAMRTAEAETGGRIPVLVHCDMRVVDEAGTEISPSYVRYQQMSPERCALNQLLVQNNVTGGALMMNGALVRLLLSRPVPRHAVMHDHWAALTAAAFGKIVFLDEALYDYRQHGGNVLGAAKGSRVREILDRLGLFRRDGKTKKEMDRHSSSVYEALFRQAAEFGRQYETGPFGILGPAERKILLAFVSMRRMNRLQKICTILRYGFTFNRLHRTAGECLFM